VDVARSGLSPTTRPAGTTIRVHGPSVGTNKDGVTVDDTRIEVWWNTEDWMDAGMGRDPHAAGPGPVLLIGSQELTGRCRYGLTVHVPDVPPGDYPLTIIKWGGGGFAGYRAATYRVTSAA
jgi:hypothetical protein